MSVGQEPTPEQNLPRRWLLGGRQAVGDSRTNHHEGIRRISRHLPALIADVAAILAVYFLVLNFRYAGVDANFHAWTSGFAAFLAIATVVHVAVNRLAGIYSITSRYMSLSQAVRVGQAGILAVAIIFVVVVIWPLFTGDSEYLVPRTVALGGGVVVVLAMIGARFTWRIIHETRAQTHETSERALLVGAGQAADMLIREILRTPSLSTRVVGLVDDTPSARGTTIQGCPVLGRVEDIPELADRLQVTQIIVAIPSARAEEVARIYRHAKPAGVPVKVLPNVAELVAGRARITDARDLDIQDLLGRKKIQTDIGEISALLNGRCVLVTGAGGSIGSELCVQIAAFKPDKLILVDHDESSLYVMHERLQNLGFNRYVLCPTSILRENKLDNLFRVHRPHVVYHAAAYKHVPLMELSPDEAVLNNIQGTLQVAETAARYGCERFVCISTDKAVQPVNVMGATKRAAELIVRMVAARYPDTLFACVRFGNVLGSQGSVIPIFREQILSGGPVTITHPGMTRYFMLIEEAVQLVLQASVLIEEDGPADAATLNTFVLDMGDPVSIVDLAQQMIEFYWKDQSRSIGVEFGGLRPGEKLDERLVWDHEFELATTHPLIKRVCTRRAVHVDADLKTFEERLPILIEMAGDHSEPGAVREALIATVPGYVPLERRAEEPLILA